MRGSVVGGLEPPLKARFVHQGLIVQSVFMLAGKFFAFGADFEPSVVKKGELVNVVGDAVRKAVDVFQPLFNVLSILER